MATRREESGNGSGLKSAALTSAKTALLAPIATLRIRVMVAANGAWAARARQAYRRSSMMVTGVRLRLRYPLLKRNVHLLSMKCAHADARVPVRAGRARAATRSTKSARYGGAGCAASVAATQCRRLPRRLIERAATAPLAIARSADQPGRIPTPVAARA